MSAAKSNRQAFFGREREAGRGPTLDLKDLRCFVAVYELRGFARAARALNTVQSSVSTRVRRLESFVGAPLFHRVHRNVTPTAKGVLLYRYARKVLDQVGELESVVRVEKPAA